MNYIKLFESFHNEDDVKLTNFRKSIHGYGDVNELGDYNYNNEKNVDEVFDIIESIIFNSLVAQKMNEYENEVDEELNRKTDTLISFVKGFKGLSFSDGELKLDNINKSDVIKAYINKFGK